LLQIDPREDFLSYLDEEIFIQQHYTDFKTSDTFEESEGSEEQHEAADAAEEEKEADATEEENKEGDEEEKNQKFENIIIRSKTAKCASK